MKIEPKKIEKAFVTVKAAFIVADMVNIMFGGKSDKKYFKAKGKINLIIAECQNGSDKEKIEQYISELIDILE